MSFLLERAGEHQSFEDRGAECAIIRAGREYRLDRASAYGYLAVLLNRGWRRVQS